MDASKFDSSNAINSKYLANNYLAMPSIKWKSEITCGYHCNT